MMRKTTRGFTLVEAVIAMALILIISAAVLTMMLSASRAQGREMAHHAASTHLADIITVYRASEDEAEFKTNLAFALGMDAVELDSVPLADGYTAKIVCGETMTITVTDPKDKQKEYTFTNPLWGVTP